MKRQQRRSLERHMARVADAMTAYAKTDAFDGTATGQLYLSMCRHVDPQSGHVVLFTRDSGHHTSGWLRNPDYERCYHLSLSPIPNQVISAYQSMEPDADITRMWCEAFFGEHFPLAWSESPKSAVGRQCGVWHWRVFADEHWEPFKPRGEVYSSLVTELGWKSATEVFELTGKPEPVSTLDPT